MEINSSATDSDASVSADSDPQRPVKKRKPTYLVVKDEKERLNKEIEELEAKVAVLKERSGLPGVWGLENTMTGNAVLGNILRKQQLLITNAQADLSARMRGPAPIPLYSYIHLSIDIDARRRFLLGMRASKLKQGFNFVEARSQNLDLLQPYLSDEKFQDSQGNYCGARFEVAQFVGVRFVLDVFNAAMVSFDHEEISQSERLGHITVRDDYDVEGDSFANCRMLSEDENGVKTEMNTVAFGEFMDAARAPGGQSYAVLVRDTVDVDDLYPYNPSEYVRKDYVAVMVLALAKRKKEGLAAPGDEDELVVTMRSAVHTKIHRPSFPMPERTQQDLRQDMASWCDVMVASMRSLLSMPDA